MPGFLPSASAFRGSPRWWCVSVHTVFVLYINRSMSYVPFESGFWLCIMSVKFFPIVPRRNTRFSSFSSSFLFFAK